MEDNGYQVITAESGPEALSIFLEQEANLDLVLLDLVMPDMSGEETLLAMRAVSSGVLFAMSTGYDTSELSLRMADKGLAGFIQKPYTFEELTTKIEEILSSRAQSSPRSI